jgi:C_GCAxxG_C_C family probable redox protein
MQPPTGRVPEEIAAALFEQGFTCGQAVLAPFAERHGLDRDTALKVACAFGGGVARTGSTCGAVNGALLAIGLAHGRTRVEDVQARERTYDSARAFLDRFRREHGSDVCRELLGVDIGTEAGRDAAMKAGLFTSRCPTFVRSAARIVATLV